MHYLSVLLAFIIHHPLMAYGAIFLISLSESLALVGLLVPGTVVMFGHGLTVRRVHRKEDEIGFESGHRQSSWRGEVSLVW